MTDFDTRLIEHLGDSGSLADIRVVVRPCWRYGFDSGDVLMWAGMGRLHTSDGSVWMGTIDGNGVDHHKTPAIKDGRDGTSGQLTFGFPFLDKASYDAMKANAESVAGRLITCYLALIEPGEGLRPAIPIRFVNVFTMQSPSFSEKLVADGGQFTKQFSLSVLAKDGNVGRSRAPGGSYTDTSGQERARILGAAPDYGYGFVAGLANKTLVHP